MKKKYLISALGLAAALMLSGCGGDKKETETSAQEKQTAAGTEASSDISGSTGETADDTDTADIVSEETETETEATIAPITPSDYLVKDASKYVTLGNYDGLEIVQYTYDVTDDMVQQQIDMDLQSAGTEEDIDTPSASGDIIYVSLKAVAEDADSELILVRSSKLRNIGRNLSLFDVWASRFQRLIDQILKHNFCLLLSSMTFHSCCRTFHTLQETLISTFSVHFLLF